MTNFRGEGEERDLVFWQGSLALLNSVTMQYNLYRHKVKPLSSSGGDDDLISVFLTQYLTYNIPLVFFL